MARPVFDGETLEEVIEKLNVAYPKQKLGVAGLTASTGERYVEIIAMSLVRNREFDIAAVKRMTLRNVSHQLSEYAEGRPGSDHVLHWRIKPEDDLADYPVVEAYDEAGPDKDFYTDRKCFMDKNWKIYKVYMRLLITKERSE